MNSENRLKLFLALGLLTLIFIFLFHHQKLGLNVLIYSGLVLATFRFFRKREQETRTDKFVQIAFMLSAIMVVLNHSLWAIWVTFIFGLVLIGRLASQHIRSVVHSLIMGVHSMFFSFSTFFGSIGGFAFGNLSLRRVFRWGRIVFIPTFVIGLFLGLYAFSSPGFSSVIVDFFQLFDWLVRWFELVDIQFFGLLVLGLILHIGLLYFTESKWLLKTDVEANDTVPRRGKHKPVRSKPMDLLVEYRSGVYLLAVLNVLLALVNYFDIVNVWIEFNWNGEYLRNYVHRGTGMLLFSILVSIIIVLYYFRGNLNFYKNNIWLKRLALLWLAQNAILALSVLFRIMQYISHFNLAFGRIAMLFILALVLFGIYTVWMKILRKKSFYNLLRVNGIAWMVAMLVGTTVDWHSFVASYNLKRYEHAFVHFEFIGDLQYQALDDCDFSFDEALVIQNERVFPYNKHARAHAPYMSAPDFKRKMERKKKEFRRDWKRRSLLSWNLAEQLAYNRITE